MFLYPPDIGRLKYTSVYFGPHHNEIATKEDEFDTQGLNLDHEQQEAYVFPDEELTLGAHHNWTEGPVTLNVRECMNYLLDGV